MSIFIAVSLLFVIILYSSHVGTVPRRNMHASQENAIRFENGIVDNSAKLY